MPAFNFIHASGRWSMVEKHLAADVKGWRGKASVITHTEIGGLSEAQVEAAMGGPTWDFWRAPNVPGQDECAVQWDAAVWSLVSGAPVLLTKTQHWVDVDKGEKPRLYPPYYAAVVTLRHIATGETVTVIAVHFPTRRTELRIRIWTECAIKVRELAKAERAAGRNVIVSADWNAGWRKPVEQLLLKNALAGSGLAYAWDGRVPKVVDDSLIDGVATDLPVTSCSLLPVSKSAEEFHQPVLVGLTLPDRTPTTPEAPVAKPYLIEHPPARRQFKARGTTFSGVIVVHTAESAPDTTGMDLGAEGVAKFIRGRSDPGCYHWLADSDSLIQMVPMDLQTYGDGTGSNPHAVHISAATQAAKWPGLPKAWTEKTVKNMALAAHKASDYCFKLHGVRIPARRVTKTQSSNRVEGFISHGERDPGRRTDPGSGFPWDLFFAEYKRLEGTASSPKKEAPVANNVQQGRALVEQALKKFDAARLNGKTRLGVQLMARAIRVALASGPKS